METIAESRTWTRLIVLISPEAEQAAQNIQARCHMESWEGVVASQLQSLGRVIVKSVSNGSNLARDGTESPSTDSQLLTETDKN